MTNDNLTRLQELSNSDYEIAEGQPDIRQWSVMDVSQRVIGDVDDLLFDSHSGKVRYIILSLPENELKASRRKVIIPIGLARIHEENDYVILPGSIPEKLASLPDYQVGEVNPGVENMVRHILADETDTEQGLTGHPLPEDTSSFYNHQHFDDTAFYGSRKGDTDIAQTVVAMFDDSLEAENAVIALVASGYMQENIDLSSGNLKESPIDPFNGDQLLPDVSNYINTSAGVNNEDQQAVQGGAVITVRCFSDEEAAMARSILESKGAAK